MPKPLTAIAIAKLKAKPKRYEVSDPGCAGLKVCVFPSGCKSFVCRFRFKGQLQCKLTLGPVLVNGVAEPGTTPELGTPLSLAAARELATKALREARSGTNPAAAKQRARQEERAAESDTLAAICEEYLRREGPRLRTVSQRRSDLDLLCAKALGRLPVAEITRGQFTRVLDGIADNNGLTRADRVLSSAKTLLNWHSARSDYVPVLGRGGRRTGTAERARDRTLSEEELRALWLAAESDEGPFGPFLRFVLLTAARRSEAGGLRRSELSNGVWTIPGSRYKNGKDMVVPLSAAAQKIVAAMPVLAGGDHVFSAEGSHPLGGFAPRKAAFDKVCGVTDWRLHDLRRTARTLLSKCTTPDIAERCLGHTLPVLRGTYDKHQYFDEKLHAFEALAGLIERIVNPAPVVVQMRKPGK